MASHAMTELIHPDRARLRSTTKFTQNGHFKVLREAGVVRQQDEGTRRTNRLRRDDLDARFLDLLDLAVRQGRDVAAKLVTGAESPARSTFLIGLIKAACRAR